MSRLLAITAFTLLSAWPASAQEEKKKPPPTDKRIAELITKLDDVQFHVRQDAHKALVDIGKPALPQLRKAALSPILEIQMRARKVIKEIEMKPAPP